jgi:hypothetical protein
MAMSCRPSTTLLRASVITWRGHESVPPCVWLLVALAGISLGSRQDHLRPLSSSWHKFHTRHPGRALIRRSCRHGSGSQGGHWRSGETQGKKSVGGDRATLVTNGIPSGPCQQVLTQNGPGAAPECHQRVHSASYAASMA